VLTAPACLVPAHLPHAASARAAAGKRRELVLSRSKEPSAKGVKRLGKEAKTSIPPFFFFYLVKEVLRADLGLNSLIGAKASSLFLAGRGFCSGALWKRAAVLNKSGSKSPACYAHVVCACGKCSLKSK